MEKEKIIVKSSSAIKKAIRTIVLYILPVALLLLVIFVTSIVGDEWEFEFSDGRTFFLLFGIIALLIIPVILLIFKLLQEPELVVTDKRIYGITFTGKRVDLPISKISAVGTGIFNRVSVSTSSGAIGFLFIKNQQEVYQAISELLIKKEGLSETSEVDQNTANIDDLKKYKELLDSGVITEQEFETKKKQILGL